jgi:uncharacterized membrane protein YhaH (DUF805 family)
MAEVVTALVFLAIFIAIYVLLQRRARDAGRAAPVRWGWLAAIVACAAVALVFGAVIR